MYKHMWNILYAYISQSIHCSSNTKYVTVQQIVQNMRKKFMVVFFMPTTTTQGSKSCPLPSREKLYASSCIRKKTRGFDFDFCRNLQYNKKAHHHQEEKKKRSWPSTYFPFHNQNFFVCWLDLTLFGSHSHESSYHIYMELCFCESCFLLHINSLLRTYVMWYISYQPSFFLSLMKYLSTLTFLNFDFQESLTTIEWFQLAHHFIIRSESFQDYSSIFLRIETVYG